jgi:lipopolysaccharide/colanic/teichoic acid biosynthesis glycosyltransferase
MEVDPLDRAQRLFKRMLDVALAVLALALAAPFLALAALLVTLTSPGPVFFRQTRVGKNGRQFTLLKFRTMVDGAEKQLDDVLELNEAHGHMFKIKDDPRVTGVGRVLRRWSFDEFPQFINVLRGDMSVVGPRPPLPREVEGYETMHYCRLKGRPGITGLWQVSDRSSFSFNDMVRLDRYYLENWSLSLDVGILLKTVLVVLRKRGSF